MADIQPEQEIQSGVEHFVKKFTVIDFLSMFVPGSVVILALNYYVGGVTEPFLKFFGHQDVVLVAYFILISYVTGMLIQEVSKFLERFWKADLIRVHRKWQKREDVKKKYQECFGESLDTDMNEKEKDAIGKKIYLHIADCPENDSKLSLFSAFSLMGRNGVITVFIVYLLVILFGQFNAPEEKVLVQAAALIIAVLLERRGRRFKVLSCERMYRDFLRQKRNETGQMQCGAFIPQ